MEKDIPDHEEAELLEVEVDEQAIFIEQMCKAKVVRPIEEVEGL